MKLIKLTQGKFTKVDDSDYEWLNQWPWYFHKTKGGRYNVTRSAGPRKNRKHIIMPRLIMCCPKNKEVDHADGDALNNQKYNLRICTRSQNCANRKSWSQLKYRGVNIVDNKYITAQIQINKRRIYLGVYPTKEDAALAYDKAAINYFGEFANLNFKNKLKL